MALEGRVGTVPEGHLDHTTIPPSPPSLLWGDGPLPAGAPGDDGGVASIDLSLRLIGVATIWTRPMERERGKAAGTGVRTTAGPPSGSSTKLTSVSMDSVKSGSMYRSLRRTRARIWTQPDSPVIVVVVPSPL